MARSTAEVIDDHLRRREAGDLEGDLETNYAADVVLLCEHGPMHGRAGVRQSAQQLAKQIPGASFEYLAKVIEGEFVLLFWRGESRQARAEHGVDSFVVRNGQIVMQTVACELRGR
jgi:hypothetical protein